VIVCPKQPQLTRCKNPQTKLPSPDLANHKDNQTCPTTTAARACFPRHVSSHHKQLPMTLLILCKEVPEFPFAAPAAPAPPT